jgi:hypothetical protein
MRHMSGSSTPQPFSGDPARLDEAEFSQGFALYLDRLRGLTGERRRFDPRAHEWNPNAKKKDDLDLDLLDTVIGLQGLGQTERVDGMLVDQQQQVEANIARAEEDITTKAIEERIRWVGQRPAARSFIRHASDKAAGAPTQRMLARELNALRRQLKGRRTDYTGDPEENKLQLEALTVVLGEAISAFRDPLAARARRQELQARLRGVADTGATDSVVTGSLSDMLQSQPTERQTPAHMVEEAKRELAEEAERRAYLQLFADTVRADAREAAAHLLSQGETGDWILSERRTVNSQSVNVKDWGNEDRDVIRHVYAQAVLQADGLLVVDHSGSGGARRRSMRDIELRPRADGTDLSLTERVDRLRAGQDPSLQAWRTSLVNFIRAAPRERELLLRSFPFALTYAKSDEAT